MKKLLLNLTFLLLSSIVFSEGVINGSEKIIENFWENGSYIKIIKDKKNICYVHKQCVAGINVDEDDYEIASMGYNIWSGKNGDSTSYNVKKWNITSDENGNIIIHSK